MWILLILFAVAVAWTPSRKEERIPLELRIVNEGLAHDEVTKSWLFSNQHVLYKTSIDPIKVQVTNANAIPKSLRDLKYDHIGDIDVYNNTIYGGIENKDGLNAALATFDINTLEMINYVVTDEPDLPWVAVDPSTKILYSARWNDCCSLKMYNADTLEYLGLFPVISSGNATNSLPNEVQGGAFYNGDLYICVNADDNIYKIDMKTGNIEFVLSDAYNHHQYEMEGIDFYDLQEEGLGVMHLYGNFMSVEKQIRNYDP